MRCASDEIKRNAHKVLQSEPQSGALTLLASGQRGWYTMTVMNGRFYEPYRQSTTELEAVLKKRASEAGVDLPTYVLQMLRPRNRRRFQVSPMNSLLWALNAFALFISES